MGKIRINYLLSVVGQKALLLAGGDGKRLQVIEVEPTEVALALAEVDREGRATIECQNPIRWKNCVSSEPAIEYDAAPTVEVLLADESARRERVRAGDKERTAAHEAERAREAETEAAKVSAWLALP